MKSIHNVSRFVLFCAALTAATLCPQQSQATPYASCISNNATAQTVTFYLNESGGNAVVTYNDGTTNANFNGITTGTNLLSGAYTFSLAGETTYSIAVTKFGTGTPGLMPNVIQNTNTIIYSTNHILLGTGDPRGVAVNVNPTSPYFGRIYLSRGGNATTALFDVNSDGSANLYGSAGVNAGVTTWATASPYSSPNRISIAANDMLVVADWSLANAGVWLVDPNLTTNELILGPIGDANGKSAGVHGAEVSPPVLLGNLASGATLMVVDSDLTTPNSLLVYSNITDSALAAGSGWQNAPDYVGPEVAINFGSAPGAGVYLFPSLCVGPNGYVYAGEYRSGVTAGDPAFVQVYDATVHSQLWTSRYTNGTTAMDRFFTAASGGTTVSPTGLSISPDGKYLATVAADNHFTICSLTNGIPDISTIYTIKPDRAGGVVTSDGGAEVAWDVADNLYIAAGFNYGVKVFTLGQSVEATTIGNASGVTAFTTGSLIPVINVYATNNSAISQANTYGNPTSGSFTITRTGLDVDVPLTVNFTYSGTATNGTYTPSVTGSVLLAPGQTSTNITITAVTDGIPRLTTFLTLTVTPSPTNYSVVGSGAITMSILNTAEPKLVVSVGAASMYNAFSNDDASVTLTRLGDTNTTFTVSSFTFAGTAVEGTDYTAPTPVNFVPGNLTGTSYIYPLNNGQVPTHSTTLPYSGNKTVIVGLGSGGSTYTVATNTATLTIVDSAVPPETVLYADPLTSSADAANWGILAANDDMGNLDPDYDVEFGSDLTATPFYSIPFPPNGSQYALKMTVNKGNGINGGGNSPATAVNAYMTNQVFSGNYAVRFNMNIIEGDCSALENGLTSYNPEETALMGINHNGLETNLFFPSTQLGAGITQWPADGLWYSLSDSGGRYDNLYAPYDAYAGNGSPTTNTGWALLNSAAKSTFNTAFKTNVFTAYASQNIPPYYNGGWTEGGPGLVANGSKTLGFNVSSWSDVEIRQLGQVVTLSIDKTPIFVYTNTTMFTNGFLMLGYEDPYDGGEQPDTAVYYSNLRVVSIGGPTITSINTVGSNEVITFNVTDDGGTFILQRSATLNGTFATVAATFTPLGNGTFQVTTAQSGGTEFYRILQQ